ncbi:MAG: phosphoglucosamine mutase [Planctomycetota bacterium]|jgi:phosphomannomutase
MTEQLIISVSGMRGVVGETLTPSIAAEYGGAFGTFLRNRQTSKGERLSVCIGRDSRPSGPALQSAVTEGLCSVGIDVIDLGIVTTPGVGIMIGKLACNGGIVVTASHNPAHYNGIKLLLDNGMAPPPDAAEQIRQYFFDKNFAAVEPSGYGKLTLNGETDAVHVARVLAIIDQETIAAKKFRVALDSVNGAGGGVTKRLLAELNCKIIAINDQPTGLFPHAPEPTAQNITTLCEVVQKEKAEIGFAQDPDADRLAIIDETGAYVGEEYTLALAAKYVFSRRTGRAATNLSTSRMIDDIAAKAGGLVIRTPVGEANVAAAMLEHNCVIGGEGNGGVIDLAVGPIRDSLVGIALILQLMAQTEKTIGQLVREIPRYYIIKDKFAADQSQAQHMFNSAKKIFAGAKLDTSDGCRFDFDDGWLHVRTSNTEPVIRVIAEAKNRQVAQGYVDKILNIRKQIGK